MSAKNYLYLISYFVGSFSKFISIWYQTAKLNLWYILLYISAFDCTFEAALVQLSFLFYYQDLYFIHKLRIVHIILTKKGQVPLHLCNVNCLGLCTSGILLQSIIIVTLEIKSFAVTTQFSIDKCYFCKLNDYLFSDIYIMVMEIGGRVICFEMMFHLYIYNWMIELMWCRLLGASYKWYINAIHYHCYSCN